MKTLFAFMAYLFLLSFHSLSAQQMAPGIKWQKSFGGSLADEFTPFNKQGTGIFPKISLNDHDGYLIAGEAASNDGDIVGSHGLHDIWVSKLDSSKNIVWSISLGGTDDEILGSVRQDNDGGYLVVGETRSRNGDIDSITINRGLGWIVKLSHEGKIKWKKTFGNKLDDTFFGDVQVLGNEGYIVVGYTRDPKIYSGTTKGDLWILKLDRSGDLIWQKGYGGSEEDADACNIKVTQDSGFILAAVTNSSDKDVTGFHSGTGSQYDVWVVKLTSGGIIQWTRCLGGTGNDWPGDIQITSDGGYIFVGTTNSHDGDVTELKGNYDAWAVKLTSSGQIQWQKTFGGSGSETLTNVMVMPDKSYIAIGSTSSFDGDVKFNHGSMDYWLINFNDSGQIIWETTYGGSGNDLAIAVNSLPNNEFVVLGESNSIDQQVLGNHGNYDLWLIKVGSSNSISGYTFYDANSNGIKDLNELFIDQVKVSSERPAIISSSFSLNGAFKNEVDTGTFITKAFPFLNYYTVFPDSKTTSFSSLLNNDIVNFALQPIPGKIDVTISIVPVSYISRPGSKISYKLNYRNLGTEAINTGIVKLVKDHRLTFLNASPAQSNINNDTIYWNYNSFQPLDSHEITLEFMVGLPPAVNFGDTLALTATIDQIGIDLTPLDNVINIKQFIFGSYDPNDKSESHGGSISRTQVTDGEYLNYCVRFQNTGNDTAFTISVRDTLDSKLDWNTLQMITSSHPYQLIQQNNNQLTWEFDNVLLPDSNINEPSSHGYIAYRIKPKANLVSGDTIKNSASIYFDYNLPVQTNIEQTKVSELVALPAKLLNFTAVLTGNSSVKIDWNTASEYDVNYFEIQKSFDNLRFETLALVKAKNRLSGSLYSIKDSSILKANNYYRLKSVDLDGNITYSRIVLVWVKQDDEVKLSVFPNPAFDQVTVEVKGKIKGLTTISITDMSGKLIFSNNLGYIKADNLSNAIKINKFGKGTYNVKVEVNNKMLNQKLIIQ